MNIVGTPTPPLVPGDLARGGFLAAIGDSITLLNGGTGFFGGLAYHTVGCMQSGGRMRPYINAGVAGNTTAQMLARVQTDVIGAATPKPARCVVLGGTNDVASVATATSLATLAAIYDALRAAGIEPIGATIPPQASNHAKIAALNAGIRSLCDRRGIHCLDFHGVLTDPSTGAYISGYSGDGTHPIAPGVRAMATVLASLAAEFPLNAPFLTDDSTDTTNMITNGVFVGDANSDGVADAWTLSGSGGTVTPTVDASDANIVGNWQVLTNTVSGQRIVSQAISAGATSPAGWAVGETLEMSGLVNAVVEAGGSAGPQARVLFGGVGTVEAPFFSLGVDITRGIFFRRFVVPTGATTITVQLYNAGAAPFGTSTVKFARLTLINPTRLGLA